MTETTAATLTDFLLARIAEDEVAANTALALSTARDQGSVRWHWIVATWRGSQWHPTTVTPARVLAECKAKRRIMERHSPTEFHDAPSEYACSYHPSFGFWPCPDLLDLAAVYADHPDYREDWRP